VIVIKLGGSLAASGNLLFCLDKIVSDYQGKAVVIVPGGGAFADHVRQAQRQWQFDGRAAHCMAILAMQQMALLFNGLKPMFKIAATISEIREQLNLQNITIWSPNLPELDRANIPSSWDITSDSLAAWLAKMLDAEELILVKSVIIDADFDVLKLMREQVVDASFAEYIQQANFKVNIVNAEKFLS
jgi:5-(aminomethyl)-3-furanmethanol phosphate kinase